MPILLIYVLFSKFPFLEFLVAIEPGRSLLMVCYHELLDRALQISCSESQLTQYMSFIKTQDNSDDTFLDALHHK